MRESCDRVIQNFFLYDPFDCSRYHNNKKSTAYTITVLLGKDWLSDTSLAISNVDEKNFTFSLALNSGSMGVWFGACSADLSYVAVCFNENGNNQKVSFFSIDTEKN